VAAGAGSEVLKLGIEIPPQLIDTIVDEVVRRVRQDVQPSSRWLCGAQQAADYLGWPVARVYRRVHELPHYREGGLLMFRTDELDAHVEEGYQGPQRPAQPGGTGRSGGAAGAPTRFQASGSPRG
jgi:hypothetical protein